MGCFSRRQSKIVEVSGELAACPVEEERLVVIADTGCGQIQFNKLLEEEPRAPTSSPAAIQRSTSSKRRDAWSSRLAIIAGTASVSRNDAALTGAAASTTAGRLGARRLRRHLINSEFQPLQRLRVSGRD
jgi:hypothetical protein